MQYTSWVYLLTLLSLVRANRDELWQEWKRLYHKNYNDASELARRAQWERNVEEIQAHNLRHDLGLETYTMGLNQFSDLSWDEFERKYLNRMLIRPATPELPKESFASNRLNDLPESLDWREQGIVTPVKNQGRCGACWAFSTIGAIESQYLKKYNETKLFSEQQLIDCSSIEGNRGCDGGSTINAFDYLAKFHLEPASAYPYVAHQGTCQFNESKSLVKLMFTYDEYSGREVSVKDQVALHGPATAAINVDKGFVSYRSGVYTSSQCNKYALNHAVLIVGYGTQNGADYWIVKNSWGTGWGDNGYILMARNHHNMCGIATYTSVPVIDKVNA